MSFLYKLINPPVKALLKSPLHGVMSGNTLLLEFKGKKSGRALSTPISYYIKNGTAYCFTNKGFLWWRNLTNDESVRVTIAGQIHTSQPVVESDDDSIKASELIDFLTAVPRDASHAGVTLDSKGSPNLNDIQRVVPGMVLLKFSL